MQHTLPSAGHLLTQAELVRESFPVPLYVLAGLEVLRLANRYCNVWCADDRSIHCL
jgi:hypothetical protein